MTTPGHPADALAGESVVARADALMKRRRAQAELDDVPVLTEAVALPEEDFPVLTAVADEPVATTNAATAPAPQPPVPAAALDQQMLDKLAQELTRTITARLNAELPHLVHIALQETLAHVEAELRTGIAEATDAALRDFLKDQARLTKKR